MAAIGFVVLSHDKPARLQRLLRRLGEMFDAPPIACHHDQDVTRLEAAALPSFARLVEPPVRVRWGTFAMIDAVRAAIAALYGRPDAPEWFVTLSAADYPARPAREIVGELRGGGVDAFLELVAVDPAAPDADQHPQREFVRRYFPRGARPPVPCFAGEFWITGNARAAERILSRAPDALEIERYFRGMQCPDEAFFQTVLASDPALRLHPWPLRYVDWREAWRTGAAHPKTLGVADLEAIRASGAHFARKFDPDVDAAVLDRLDAITA